ncbi:MAG: tetratricopeptide repeat protein [Chthoniobacterales bacterium]
MAKKLIATFVVVALVSAGAFLYLRGGSHRGQVLQETRPLAATADPLRVVLTPLSGEGALDDEIRNLQRKIAQSSDHEALLERLGWAFVAKARLTSDPGFYNLAEVAGKAISVQGPAAPGRALLLGHIADAQHNFAEAEKIARQLTNQRNFVFDYALLGDALMEQGKLTEAVDAYQKMVDLKPCLQTYSRVAYMRWLKGDLPGAVKAARVAVGAGSPREPEATAWAYTRLALYELQGGNAPHASTDLDLALQLAPAYAPALLMRGKLLLGEGQAAEAIAPLREAAAKSPLPDYLWTLSEALRSDGQTEATQKVEALLSKSGAMADPRTFALFLSSRGESAEVALRLANAELETRHDIFTYDALAWAQLAAGQVKEARENSLRALAEGTQDARLFYHAGAIAAADGDNADALKFLNQAHGIEQLLLPSEKQGLAKVTASVLAATSHLSSK